MVFFIEVNWSEFNELGNDIINFDISTTVNYSAIAVDFKVVISTIDLCKETGPEVQRGNESPSLAYTKPGKFVMVQKSFEFKDLVARIEATTNYCLVLLEQGELYKIMVRNFELKKINVMLSGVVSKPRRIMFTNSEPPETEPERIVDIACGDKICVGVSNYNGVYNLPLKIGQLKKQDKIKKLTCGAEHAMLLTTNGDIYTWGTGMR